MTLAGASLAHAAGTQYTPIIPCRIVDTRSGFGGALVGNSTNRQFTVRGSGLGIAGHSCSVPTTAKAVVLHVTAVTVGPEPTDFLGLFMVTDAARSLALGEVSHLNWEVGTYALANGAIVPLGTGTASNRVKVGAGFHSLKSMHLLLDVLGYFQ